MQRFTLEDREIGEYVTPAGSRLIPSTLPAMRDPAVYADPDRYDNRRTDHPRAHMAFGAGPHRCLGEARARAELQEGPAAQAERRPQLRPIGAPFVISGHSGIRRVSELRVGWSVS
ncbi:cytochrome P450 [Arenibaculum pallidiluteum]|uniref:cytochrome P450 n=1 Tax=Arenibaculum pallidiluteum TaxID=2812559 RepID=UPI001A975712|nr:cytochrome P450 [Arenibaculum pallidiluteum]